MVGAASLKASSPCSERLLRRCSEQIHGNAAASEDPLAEHQFVLELLQASIEEAETAGVSAENLEELRQRRSHLMQDMQHHAMQTADSDEDRSPVVFHNRRPGVEVKQESGADMFRRLLREQEESGPILGFDDGVMDSRQAPRFALSSDEAPTARRTGSAGRTRRLPDRSAVSSGDEPLTTGARPRDFPVRQRIVRVWSARKPQVTASARGACANEEQPCHTSQQVQPYGVSSASCHSDEDCWRWDSTGRDRWQW